jgi:hypothetical protein
MLSVAGRQREIPAFSTASPSSPTLVASPTFRSTVARPVSEHTAVVRDLARC